MTTDYTATIIKEQLAFGEGPRWHEGRLVFSDFYRHGVFSILPDGTDEQLLVEVANQPSGLGWLPDGSLLIVSMIDQRLLRLSSEGQLTVHADIAPYCGFWANDMVVSAEGVAYVGNFGFDLDNFLEERGVAGVLTPPGPPTTTLVAVAPNGDVLQVIDDMAFPNGSVITPDGGTLIVGETMRMRLTAFDIAADGTLQNRRVFAQLDMVPTDGICLDAEGQVWVANALAPEAIRVAEGGEITARVITSQTCFACMLGGPERRTLFTMTAPTSDRKIVGAGALLGRIEAAEVAVPGAGLP